MRIIKVGGRAQGEAALVAAMAAAWRETPGALCVVHGGGDEVSRLQRAFGLETRFRGGRRVTSEGDIDLLRMALSGAANKRLVSALTHAGVPALGISGEDAALLVAARVPDESLGLVGDRPAVNAALVRSLLEHGVLPVISPLARDASGGGALNVNGDDAAAAIAIALDADELHFVSDVDGVRRDGEPCATLDESEARALIEGGTATGGMVAKLEAALEALAQGVRKVRIGAVASIGDATLGTRLGPSYCRAALEAVLA